MTNNKYSALAVFSSFSSQPGGPYLWAVKIHGDLFEQIVELSQGRDIRANAQHLGYDFMTKVSPSGITEFWTDQGVEQNELEFVLLDGSKMPAVTDEDWARYRQNLAEDYQHREIKVVAVEVEISDIGLYKAHVGMRREPLNEWLSYLLQSQ